MDGCHLSQGPDPDRAVRTPGHQRVALHLQLPNQRCVALEDGMALARMRVPDTNTRVKASCCNPLAVKGNRVYLTEMTG